MRQILRERLTVSDQLTVRLVKLLRAEHTGTPGEIDVWFLSSGKAEQITISIYATGMPIDVAPVSIVSTGREPSTGLVWHVVAYRKS